MIEVDIWIRANADALGVDRRLINPASVDLRLGAHVIEYRHIPRWLTPLYRFGIRLGGNEPTMDESRVGFPTRDGGRYVMPGRTDHYLLPDQEFTFRPGRFYLAHSEEITRCPDSHVWRLCAKSTTARRGLEHLNAGFGDPDFEGQVTFEFVAFREVTLVRGARVVQLIYERLTRPPERGYRETGRYMKQFGATTPRPPRPPQES